MYQFILNLWILKKMTEKDIKAAHHAGRITEEEKDFILATPQN